MGNKLLPALPGLGSLAGDGRGGQGAAAGRGASDGRGAADVPGRGVLPLDPDQRHVLDQQDGQLLVLGAPATGRTTALVELVVARIGDPVRPIPAASVLVLGRGRRSANELADGISRRLGGGLLPVVATFHSFALAVLRQWAIADAQPVRLLNAAQQEARLRELLTFAVAEGRVRWPDSLAGALGTRGIAQEARRLLARARSLGLDGRDLTRIGRREGVPSWVAMGAFFDEYLDVMDHEGALDYSELIHRATALVAHPAEGRSVREAFRLIVVDEYEEVEASQVRLLAHLARGGAQVVAFGDPDQAVHGFQGGAGSALVQFPERFHGADGRPARTVVLRHGHGMPSAIRGAALSVLRPTTLAPLPADLQWAHRNPVDGPGGQVRATVYPDARSEGIGVAGILLRAHAGLGTRALSWSQMAVVLRNPSAQAGPVARALRAAGIPLVEPVADRSLADEPLVANLLTVMELALRAVTGPGPGPAGRARPSDPNAREGGSSEGPAGPQPEQVRAVLAGWLGGLDQLAIRDLERSLTSTGSSGSTDRSAPDVVTALLTGGATDHRKGLPPAADRVRATVVAARKALAEDQGVGSVLWAAWQESGASPRLRDLALGGGPRAGAADRALDAAVDLFELANAQSLRGPAGMSAFLAMVRSMGIAVAVTQHRARDAVQLLSAHHTKGRSWDLVVVAGVQEGLWPSVRVRGDVLRVAELGDRGLVPGQDAASMVADERRLFYVAATSARSTLEVTAVTSPDGSQRASRFLTQIGVPVSTAVAPAESLMSPTGLVAALRRAAQESKAGPDGGPDDQHRALLGQAAVTRLRQLAAGAGGAGLPGADPGTWWNAAELSGPAGPASRPGAPASGVNRTASTAGRGAEAGASLRDEAGAPRLSASAVSAVLTCPLRWFLERRVGAGGTSGTAASLGLLVHAIAEAVAQGEVAADESAIGHVVDDVWDGMTFEADYQRSALRTRLDSMVTAFLDWHRNTGRDVLAVEAALTSRVDLPGGPVELTGTIDRLDRDSEGGLHIVDFKSGRTACSAQQASLHPQLAVYQLLLAAGSLPGSDAPEAGIHAPPRASVAGAELVHLGDTYVSGLPKVRRQAALGSDPGWAEELVGEALRLTTGPRFPARPGAACPSCAFRAMCPSSRAGSFNEEVAVP